MSETPDATTFAASVLHLIQRFVGNRADALGEVRKQVENELNAGKDIVRRAEEQLAAIDQLQALLDATEQTNGVKLVPVTTPPLKKAILMVLDEDPALWWGRDQLYAEVIRRGWGPGGTNPRNTFTSRLRDLEKDKALHRAGDMFTSQKNEEVPAM